MLHLNVVKKSFPKISSVFIGISLSTVCILCLIISLSKHIPISMETKDFIVSLDIPVKLQQSFSFIAQ